MVQHNNGPRDAIEGVVDDVKGKAKEVAGVVIEDEDLKAAGHAQQDKARAQRTAAQKDAEAEKARLDAEIARNRQAGYEHDQ